MELQLRLQREEEERIAAEIKRAGRTDAGVGVVINTSYFLTTQLLLVCNQSTLNHPTYPR